MAGRHAAEWLYAGKPMSHWVADLAGEALRAPEFSEVDQHWVLAHFGQPAVPHLIEALKDARNVDAIVQLEFLGNAETVRQLTHVLIHENESVRSGALQALYGIAMKRSLRPQTTESLRAALPAIVSAARDAQPESVKRAAEHFLLEFGPVLDPAIPVPMHDLDNADPKKRRAILERIGRLGSSVEHLVPFVEAKLKDPDPSVRWAAAEALSRSNPDHPGIVPVVVDGLIHREHSHLSQFRGVDRIISETLPVLGDSLKGTSPPVRASIVNALGWSKLKVVLPILVEMQNDDSPLVRRQVVISLPHVDAPEIVPCLIRALADEDEEVRKEAIWVLIRQQARASEVVQGLVGVLDSGPPVARVAAALVVDNLRQLGKQTWPALRQNLRHPDPRVRLTATLVLARNEPDEDGVVPLTGEKGEFSSLRITEEDLEAMLRSGQEIEIILPRLINGLTPISSRATSARLLMLVGPLATPALPRLLLLLRDKPAAGTGTVHQIVANSGSKAIPLLLEMLKEKDAQVRNRAIKTLGMMGFRAKRAVPNLIDKLKNGSPSERIVAANALGAIGLAAASAVPALKAALKDRDLALIWSAVFCLKGMRARAEPAILDLLQLLDIPSLSAVMKCQMMWCLGSIGSASTPALISCLEYRDAVVRAGAAEELGQCGSRSQDTVPALIESLMDQDAGVRAAAAAALGRIGPEARCAEPELKRLLDDWCDIVRRNAQEALAAIEAARSSQARSGSEA